MTLLIVTRGLPGSGKTYLARAWVSGSPNDRIRLNRDDFRTMMHGGYIGNRWAEQAVTLAQHAAIAATLPAFNVIVDDTNLPDETVAGLEFIAHHVVGAQFKVWDQRHVPLDECLRRNALREGPARVPDEVIHRMHRDYLSGA